MLCACELVSQHQTLNPVMLGWISSAVFFALSGAARSNGLVNIVKSVHWWLLLKRYPVSCLCCLHNVACTRCIATAVHSCSNSVSSRMFVADVQMASMSSSVIWQFWSHTDSIMFFYRNVIFVITFWTVGTSVTTVVWDQHVGVDIGVSTFQKPGGPSPSQV